MEAIDAAVLCNQDTPPTQNRLDRLLRPRFVLEYRLNVWTFCIPAFGAMALWYSVTRQHRDDQDFTPNI